MDFVSWFFLLHIHNMSLFLLFAMQAIKPNQIGTTDKKKEDNNCPGGRQVNDGPKNESNVSGEVPLSSSIPVNLPASPRNISPSTELYYM